MTDRLCVTLKSALAEIDRLNAVVENFAAKNGLSVDAQTALNLALEEVVTNIITHGHQGRCDQDIQVTITLHADALTMLAEDSAPPFNPLLAPEPDFTKSLEERRPGGLGIHLLRRMMDRLEYRRVDGKNQLHMWKQLT